MDTPLYNKLNELSPYFSSIRKIKESYVIDCVFREGWDIIETDRVGFALDGGIYITYPKSEDDVVDELFSAIVNLIVINLEKEEKTNLLNSKILELSTLFNENRLSELKDLTISVKTGKNK